MVLADFPTSPTRVEMIETLPLSLLNDYLYCPRRAALKLLDGLRSSNEHTLRGDLNHEHADLPGFEHRARWKLLRALPVWSDILGLNGKADIVEVRESNGRITEARPVEYKSGRKSKWLNDRVQLCAQAFCLEEQLGIAISEGLVFHAQSKQRTLIQFDSVLRTEALDAIRHLQHLLIANRIPPAELKPQCEGCSLHDICLPEAPSRLPPDLFRVTAS